VILCILFSLLVVAYSTPAPSYSVVIRVREYNQPEISTAPYVFPGSTWNVSVTSSRTVHISEFLIGNLQETVTVKNEGNRPFNAILFFLPINAWKNLTWFEIKAKWQDKIINLPWSVYYRRGDYLAIAVKFPDFLESNETFTFNISAWLNPKIFRMFYVKNDTYYEFCFAKQPLFPYPQKRKSHFIAPPTSLFVEDILPTPFSSEGNNLGFDDDRQVEPFNDSTPINETCVLIRWYMKIIPLRMLTINREIVFGLSDEITVHEDYSLAAYFPPVSPTLLESAKWKTEAVRIGEIKGARNITARDSLGNIETSIVKTTGNVTVVQVRFRSPITAGTTYAFSLSYKLDCEDYRTKQDDSYILGSYILRIPIAPYVNATVGKYSLRLLIPSYMDANLELNISAPIMITYKSEAFGWKNYKVICISFDNFYPAQNAELEIVFKLNWAVTLLLFGKILAIIMFAFVIVLIIVRYVSLSMKKKITPPEILRIKEHKELLERYITRLEEYIALDTLIEDTIRKQIPSRSISAAFFDKMNRYLETLRKRREELYRLGDRVKRIDPDIATAITKIEECDAEIEIARELLFKDWRRFASGGIPYDVWINRASVLVSEIEKIRYKRDKFLNFLRDILDIRYKVPEISE